MKLYYALTKTFWWHYIANKMRSTVFCIWFSMTLPISYVCLANLSPSSIILAAVCAPGLSNSLKFYFLCPIMFHFEWNVPLYFCFLCKALLTTQDVKQLCLDLLMLFSLFSLRCWDLPLVPPIYVFFLMSFITFYCQVLSNLSMASQVVLVWKTHHPVQKT